MEMIDLGVLFDPAQEEEMSRYELFEAGDYAATISGASVSEKNGNKMLTLEFAIDGHSGSLFGRYNYIHSNDTAQKIARSDMKKIFEATGTAATSDAGKLLNKRLRLTVIQKMGDPYTDKQGKPQPGRMQNEITGYRNINSAPVAVTQPAVQSAPAVQAEAAQAAPAAAVAQVKKNPFAK